MKFLITLTLLLSLSPAEASFNRLWVGYKKKDVSADAFIQGLNKTFFKETIEVGQDRGLLSYQPYITAMTSMIPDEIALVIYENEQQYRAIRSTPEGERYGAAHWDFFEKETSKSTVSEPFRGELQEGKAFELSHQRTDWQKGFTTVFIYKRPLALDLVKLAQDFSALTADSTTLNSILLISKDWIIEYRSVVDEHTFARPLPLPVLEKKALPHLTLEELKEPVSHKDGVNFRF